MDNIRWQYLSFLILIILSPGLYSQSKESEDSLELQLVEIDSLITDDAEKGLQASTKLYDEVRKKELHLVAAKASKLRGRALSKLNRKDESAFAFLECAHTLISNQQIDTTLVSDCFHYSALNYYSLGIYDLALELSYKALGYRRPTGDLTSLSHSYNAIGEIYRLQGKYEMALSYYDSTLQADLKLKDTVFVSNDIGILGRINTKLGRREEGISLLQESIDILDKKKYPSDYSIALNAMGLGYSNLDEFELADRYIKDALHVADSIDDKRLIINRLINLGSLHTKFKKYDSAYKYFRESLDLMEDKFDALRYTLIHQNLGKVYHAKKEHTKAKASFKQALSIAEKGRMLPELKKIYQSMADLAYDNGELDLAFEYKDKHQLISDSIFSINAHAKANALKYKYETEKKEAEIKSLKESNKIKEENIAKIKAQQRLTIIFFTVLGILSWLSFVLFKRTQKQELKIKENEIEQQLNKISSLQTEIARALDKKPVHKKTLGIDKINELISQELTEREYEILELVIEGHSNQVIADKVFLSVNTIKFHLKKIYTKLDVANRKEIMQLLINK